MKKALLIRIGAYGDMIMATPLIRALKEDGYHVTVNCKKRQGSMLSHNPFVDKLISHDETMPNDALWDHWIKMSEGYDKVVNLTGSIEEFLLKKEGTPEFNWDHAKRHGFCNVNYYDHTLTVGGYDKKGTNGELYFSSLEISEARRLRKRFHDKFLILWGLSGSSFHKAYPYAEYVIMALINKHPDIEIFTLGDSYTEILEEGLRHPRIKNYSNKWTMRKSLSMVPFANCIVGTDTGLMVGAGCFDEIPKVLMLSHTSRENLTKYWKNTTIIEANVPCQPCHRLIYTLEACPIEKAIKSPICMARIPSRQVFHAIEDVYLQWKEKRNGKFHRDGQQNDIRGGRRHDLGERTQAVPA